MKQPSFGDEVDGAGKAFFDSVVIDNIIDSLIDLTAQVWTHRDRAIVLEEVLNEVIAKHGDLNISQMIERHHPSAAQQQQRTAEREAFATSVFRSFNRDIGATDRMPKDRVPKERGR